ncbi:MAG TPA: amidohydrolase family protein, partial [Gemmatimonadaceae bacterium]|nr:amidohydrolase family protein [Gemmatimonadaceae bacterium]
MSRLSSRLAPVTLVAAVLATLAAMRPLTAQGANPTDLLIRGGTVIDGTGRAARVADVVIRGDSILFVGDARGAGLRAAREFDARGLIVAPGFIDLHNHSDYTLLADGNAQSMIRQGVTSMILGEGGSAAPAGGKQQQDRSERATWTDFNGYFAQLLKQGISTNVGTYVGSSQVWTYVRGDKAGPPTPAELTEMQNAVRQAMQQGALGVASSLSGPPGSWID